MRSLLFTLLAVTLAVHASVLPLSHRREAAATDYVGYLFIHFYDDYVSPGNYTTYPAGEQVFGHLSNGNEATSYTPLKGGAPLLTSNVGTKGVRDFYLVSKDDQSQHYIIATDLNQTAIGGFSDPFLSRSLVIWDSEGSSLTNWQEPRLVEVVPENFRMAWAPESLYIAEEDRFMVYWSSNVYSDASHSGNPDSDKIYYSYTSDFKTFTDPQQYIALPNNVGIIDLTMHPTGVDNEYVRFFKDESVGKCRGQVSTNGIFGDWSDIGSSTEYVDNNSQSEGKYKRLTKCELRLIISISPPLLFQPVYSSKIIQMTHGGSGSISMVVTP